MVCLVCLLPLFLVPVVNVLPLLVDFLMGKIYRLFGWEYRKPERAPPSCPIKPSATKTNNSIAEQPSPVSPDLTQKSAGVDGAKLD